MPHEFSRMEMLIGSSSLKRLASASAAVFGLGGVGAQAALALARSGVGRLFLIDSDSVSLTNINRQAIAFHSTIGQPKTAVLKEMIRDICPRIQVVTYEEFVLPENAENLFSQISRELCGAPLTYILDAVDTVSAKLALAAYAYENQIPILSAMGTGNKLRPELLRISDIKETSVCPLCRVMRRELKARRIPSLKVCWSPEPPLTPGDPEPEEAAASPARRSIPGSTAFVPPAAGLLMAAEAVRDICGLQPPSAPAHSCADTLSPHSKGAL